MIYLLDTNTCIRFLNGRSQSIFERLNQTDPTHVRVCAIVKAEMYFGAMKSHDPQSTLGKQQIFLGRFISLPFDDGAAEIYGIIRAELSKKGTPIGPSDLLIAAIALANDVTLVTHNTREFSRVTGLRLEDWETV